MDAMNGSKALPEGIFSFLDTDLYKLTMQCAILKYFSKLHVTYAFINRTSHMKLTREAYRWLTSQIDKLANITLCSDELQYLKTTCPYFNHEYLGFLSSFRLHPSRHVRASFDIQEDTGGDKDKGELHLSVDGLWLDTILYEIPLLALTSEAYFKFCDIDWSRKGQEQTAHQKATTLLENGCVFSEFGTRRRRDYQAQDTVIQGLTRAAREHNGKGKLSGTSNVHFAMKYSIPPVGTVAHEWFMGIASVTNDYEHANETALRYWVGCFGRGVLGIALTDTFGTPTFLKSFRQPIPATPPTTPPPIEHTAIGGDFQKQSYAQIFAGVRQDSGDPLRFVKVMRDFYDSEGIKDKKTIVFSDSLNIDLCLKYKVAAEEAGFAPTFGIGTFFTNDFHHISNGKKSTPLNIVIKLSSAGGKPAVKISDNIGKNTGDPEKVHEVKERLGYAETQWARGDEKTRWGPEDEKATTAEVQA